MIEIDGVELRTAAQWEKKHRHVKKGQLGKGVERTWRSPNGNTTAMFYNIEQTRPWAKKDVPTALRERDIACAPRRRATTLPAVAARRSRSLPLRHTANRSPWAAYDWLRLRGRQGSLALRDTVPVRLNGSRCARHRCALVSLACRKEADATWPSTI